MRRPWRALAAVAAVAASAVIWHNLPTNSDVYAPFDVRGVPGQRIEGRAVGATVTGVRTAAVVDTPQPVAAIGRWVLVDTEMKSGLIGGDPHAELVVGSDTYAPTDRLPPGVGLGEVLAPGIRSRGSWVFDVAPSLLDARAPMTLRLWVDDGRLDSRLNIALDLGKAASMQTAKVGRPDRVAS